MSAVHLCIPEAEQRKRPCTFSSFSHILLQLKYVDTVSQAWDQFSPRSKALVKPPLLLSTFIP